MLTLQYFWVVFGGSQYQSNYFIVLPATQLDRSDPSCPHGTLEEHADTTMLFESLLEENVDTNYFLKVIGGKC